MLVLARPPLPARVSAYLALTKPRIIELLLVTTVPAMIVANRGLPSLSLILLTLLGGSLAAAGANAINMYIDRDIDSVMKRTSRRPLVTGELSPRNALTFAVILEIVATLVLWQFVNFLSAALALAATCFYVVVYSLWLKRSSSSNIVIGGAAGAVPVLIGWAAVTGSLGWSPFVLFAIIFLWTPPHFWALAIRYRQDYSAANVPMLPVVASLRATAYQIFAYTLALSTASLVFIPVANMGVVYGAAALVLGFVFCYLSFQLIRNPMPNQAMSLFNYSITYVTLLFGAIAIDQMFFEGWQL